ncbi:alkyl/aryl-sulfatase [Stenotrophobium rhamnosiphilum]|nr:alkyl sulfatase dimerization domain-containing protein [Stenotrophobium rhamnosiphilum]
MKKLLGLCLLVAVASGCSKTSSGVGGSASDVMPATQKANEEMAKSLNLADQRDFENAARGLIAKPTGKILDADGKVLVDFSGFDFIQGAAPATVNPSLWRHALQNKQAGLFKVMDGIYQLRGFDISNMTLIEGKTGWIVVDPLTAREVSVVAIEFARKHLGNKPISAMIYTHSHVDHFGGVLGVLSKEDAAARKIPIIAPSGFMEEATSENVMVGVAMGRRSGYQFGKNLERSAKGFVDAGLGKNLAYGSFGLIPPTVLISQPTQELEVDGLRFVFHNVPNTEAPAELSFNLPDMKAYCGAEILAQTMHNLLPIRGAKVRDSLSWSRYLDEAVQENATTEVYFASHNWPVWGPANVTEFISKQRDMYRYIHDQTVRYMNAGYTPNEIANMVKLPKSLSSYFGVRGYYGDIRHNVKAVYQFYLGNYDGNPAHLNSLPPADAAKRYVALMGGANKTIAAAQKSFDEGDYRWAAELLNHVVFADGSNAKAKTLLARTYDQMGYMSESSTWRNSYLTASDELRNGPPTKGVSRANFLDVLMQTPVERFLDAMAAALNAEAAEDKNYKINLVFSDLKETHVLWIENAVLHHRKAPAASDANATLQLTHPIFIKMMANTANISDTLLSDDLKTSGSRIDLVRFFGLFDKAQGTFNVIVD